MGQLLPISRKGCLASLGTTKGRQARRLIVGACRLAAMALAILAGTKANAQVQAQVKAVFLFNFTQFVVWPMEVYQAADDPLIIGILGEDPFGRALDEAVRGEKIGTHALALRRYRRVEEIEGCHILYISRSEEARLESIFARLKGRTILTVGDSEGFARRGGMIRFVIENNKVRMRINVEEATAVGLTISSKLLRPAEIIGTRKE
jgi:hypothetical protein